MRTTLVELMTNGTTSGSTSKNQTPPSWPAVMAVTSRSCGRVNRVTTPLGVIREMVLGSAENQTLPSGPEPIEDTPTFACLVVGKSVTTPVWVIRPTSPPESMNQIFPSGPAVSCTSGG